jgi:hypothetical protein
MKNAFYEKLGDEGPKAKVLEYAILNRTNFTVKDVAEGTELPYKEVEEAVGRLVQDKILLNGKYLSLNSSSPEAKRFIDLYHEAALSEAMRQKSAS